MLRDFLRDYADSIHAQQLIVSDVHRAAYSAWVFDGNLDNVPADPTGAAACEAVWRQMAAIYDAHAMALIAAWEVEMRAAGRLSDEIGFNGLPRYRSAA